MKAALSLLILALVSLTNAQAETQWITGATIHTVTGPVIPNGNVLIENGTIKRVEAANSSASAPTGAKTIDLRGLHLYPGLIALNTELGLVEIGAVRATHDQSEVGEFTPDVRSWIAVNPDSELLPVARANGITHFEPAPQGGVIAGQSGLVALDGWTSEQMTMKQPVALHVYWPSVDLDTTPKELVRDKSKWKSLEDQAEERRKRIRELGEFFSEARAYAKARDAATTNAFTRVPAWEAMLPYVNGEAPLTIHADDVRQIRSAVTWAQTNQFRIILAEGRDAWQAAPLLASNNIPVIYNHVFTRPEHDWDAYDVQFSAPAVLSKAGVKVIFGLGEYRASLVKNLPYEAAQAVAFGLPAEEALKGITTYPAETAGISDRLGSIEEGKEASFFAADGDILDIRSNVKRLWIAGKEVSLDSRHTRLYEKYRNRPR